MVDYWLIYTLIVSFFSHLHISISNARSDIINLKHIYNIIHTDNRQLRFEEFRLASYATWQFGLFKKAKRWLSELLTTSWWLKFVQSTSVQFDPWATTVRLKNSDRAARLSAADDRSDRGGHAHAEDSEESGTCGRFERSGHTDSACSHMISPRSRGRGHQE